MVYRALSITLILSTACQQATTTNNGVTLIGMDDKSGFSMTVPVTEYALVAGTTTPVSVSVTRVKGVDAAIGSIVFALAQAPAGLAASGELLETATTMELQLVASSSIAPGAYDVVLKGRAGEIEQLVSLHVVILEAGKFAITLGMSMLVVYAGSSGPMNVGITRGPTLMGDVTLSTTNLPTGMSAAFVPTATSATTTALTLNASTTTEIGQYAIVIEGTHPDAGKSNQTLIVEVQQPPPTCTDTCVASAPSGFLGPVAVKGGTSFPSCTGAFANPAIDRYTDITDPPSVCTCGCNSPGLAVICKLHFVRYASSDTTCTTPDTYSYNLGYPPDANACLGYGGPVYRWKPTNIIPEGSSCTGNGGSTTLPASTKTSVRACSGSFPQIDCGADQLCVPVPPDRSLCIYAEGDVTCPLTTYTAKKLHYAATTETRACSACTCSTANDCSAAPTTFSHGASSCNTSSPIGACVSGGNIGYSATYAATTCTANPIGPVGHAGGSGPTTVCCKP